VQQELKSYSVSVIMVNIEVASESAALLILQCDTGLKRKTRKNKAVPMHKHHAAEVW
jgi:hypothetical protein